MELFSLQYPQGHWDLPKGHVEDNDENNQITAARELVKKLELPR